MSLTNEELEALVSSWSSLKSLRLNSNPIKRFGPRLTLACLFSLAHHRPNLVEPELYLDATLPIPVPATFQTLPKLKELDVGTSPIENAHMVSIFLYRLCSIDCSLHMARDPSHYGEPDDQGEKLKRYETLWVQVAGCLPLIRKYENGEKERTLTLHMELQGLRSENKMLQDQLKLQANEKDALP